VQHPLEEQDLHHDADLEPAQCPALDQHEDEHPPVAHQGERVAPVQARGPLSARRLPHDEPQRSDQDQEEHADDGEDPAPAQGHRDRREDQPGDDAAEQRVARREDAGDEGAAFGRYLLGECGLAVRPPDAVADAHQVADDEQRQEVDGQALRHRHQAREQRAGHEHVPAPVPV
jgi:hypothetical protein